jgi:hypothetical protein
MTAVTLANSLKCTSTDVTGDVTNSLNKFLNNVTSVEVHLSEFARVTAVI